MTLHSFERLNMCLVKTGSDNFWLNEHFAIFETSGHTYRLKDSRNTTIRITLQYKCKNLKSLNSV